jgi:LPS export ABC transporter protein LptC
MQKIKPQVIRFGLIGVGAALLIYALNIAENTYTGSSSEILTDASAQKPSAYLTESTFNIFDTNGKLSKLYASKAFFYADKDSITIEFPRFSTSHTNASMQLTANMGYYNPTAETLILKGNVVAKQTDQGSLAWQLVSNTLDIDNKLGTLSTQDKVTITYGSHSLSAIGFEGSFNQKEIKLLSKVRGKYVL